MEMPAMVCNIVISFIIPLIIWIILVIRNKDERKGMIMLFILGVLFYAGMQWGIKQHGLAYLFNHTDFQSFMENHYIPYLLVVALAGAILAVIPEWITIRFAFGSKVTFKQAVAFGLGYTISETGFLIVYPGIMTFIMYFKEKETEFATSVGELFLSGYERILLTIIGTGLIVILTYFIEQKMVIRGIIIKVICQMLIAFLPGFFIAFSTKNYLEVFDRSMTLVMVYVVLTVACVCSIAVMNSLKWKMYEK